MISYIKISIVGALVGIGIGLLILLNPITNDVIFYQQKIVDHGRDNYYLYKINEKEYLISCHGSEDGYLSIDGQLLQPWETKFILLQKGELPPNVNLKILCCYCGVIAKKPGKYEPALERRDQIYVNERIPYIITIGKW